MFFKKVNPVILLFLLLFFSGSTPAPFFNKETVLLELVQSSIRYGHYDPKPMDDRFSERVFDLFLVRLDNQKRFLTNQDVKFLSQYRNEIDNQIKSGSYEFLNACINIIEKRIQQTEGFYKISLSKKFEFDELDSMESDREKLSYVPSEKELELRWRRNLKYATLARVYTGLEKNKDLEDSLKKSFIQLEQDSRDKVLENHDEWFNRLNKQERDDWLASYLDVIVSVNDPHTGYFPPKDKEDFDIQMSGRLEGIGARLSQKGDYIKVVDVVPGSACWRQGELEIGDLIIEVGEGDGETTDLVGMRVDHAVKLIRGKKGTEVRLTVQKVDGSVKIIPIIRDIVQLEQTYARSVFLENKNSSSKIGYIFLPKFYSNFNSPDGRTCSRDVKKELEKLIMDGADKIMIDLRNNGGGSLQEVVKMAGLFVDKGPIVQVKGRYGDPYILKDVDPGTVFDGPLVIMTNFFSASASEILAAALQDYDRALIIGSNNTYGKGTVQRFFELDKEMDRLSKGDHADLKPLGSLKMTVQKFYRIDGKSTQLRGVIPDIILPDNYEMIDVGEKDYENALSWDEIASTNYSPLTVGLSQELRPILENSRARISLDPYFQAVKNNAIYLRDQKEFTKIPMDLDGYTHWRQVKKEKYRELKDLTKVIEDFKVIPLSSDAIKMEVDSIFRARREKWIKSIRKDHHLYEALNITADLRTESH